MLITDELAASAAAAELESEPSQLVRISGLGFFKLTWSIFHSSGSWLAGWLAELVGRRSLFLAAAGA